MNLTTKTLSFEISENVKGRKVQGIYLSGENSGDGEMFFGLTAFTPNLLEVLDPERTYEAKLIYHQDHTIKQIEVNVLVSGPKDGDRKESSKSDVKIPVTFIKI